MLAAMQNGAILMTEQKRIRRVYPPWVDDKAKTAYRQLQAPLEAATRKLDEIRQEIRMAQDDAINAVENLQRRRWHARRAAVQSAYRAEAGPIAQHMVGGMVQGEEEARLMGALIAAAPSLADLAGPCGIVGWTGPQLKLLKAALCHRLRTAHELSRSAEDWEEAAGCLDFLLKRHGPELVDEQAYTAGYSAICLWYSNNCLT